MLLKNTNGLFMKDSCQVSIVGKDTCRHIYLPPLCIYTLYIVLVAAGNVFQSINQSIKNVYIAPEFKNIVLPNDAQWLNQTVSLREKTSFKFSF